MGFGPPSGFSSSSSSGSSSSGSSSPRSCLTMKLKKNELEWQNIESVNLNDTGNNIEMISKTTQQTTDKDQSVNWLIKFSGGTKIAINRMIISRIIYL